MVGNKSIKYFLITNAQECFKVSRFSQTTMEDEDAAQAGIDSKWQHSKGTCQFIKKPAFVFFQQIFDSAFSKWTCLLWIGTPNFKNMHKIPLKDL